MVEPKFPFARLAILPPVGEDQKKLIPVRVRDQQDFRDREVSYSNELDSRRSLRNLNSYPSSYDGSIHGSYRSGSLPTHDSHRSLRASSSLSSQEAESGMQSLRSTIPLADQPIAEERPVGLPPRHSDDRASIPEVPTISEWSTYDDLDFSGKTSQRTPASSLSPTMSTSELNSGQKQPKERRGFNITDPFSHLRICKKKRKNCHSQCRWDMFPAIRLSDASAKKLNGQASVGQSSPPSTLKALHGQPSDSQASPRGPLSVESGSEFETSHSGMEQELVRTFALEDLDASENSTSESSDMWGSGANRTQQSKAASAPETSNRPKQQPLPRATTAPDLGDPTASVKDTGKLRIERFKGITFVNEYALVRTLGRGSFGKVKLAFNTSDHDLYGLKLIPKSRRRHHRTPDGSPHVAEADVMQEINVMKELSHPNIVRLHEVIDDPLNSKMLMVLEYVEGGSMFAGTKLSPKRRLTELSARKYFRDVLQGLDYLHANKIAHGDLKPDNLLLASNGHIKIADFGSSQLTRCCDLVNRTAGTPAFMAPEMCSGQPYHAGMADVWALGVCLYMFIFGTVPFKSDSILGLYDEISNAPLVFPRDIFVSNSLKHLLARLLDKDPDTRISLTGAMHHNWVTHNGGYPLPNIQGLEPDEEEDNSSLLMECWPDDPADIGLESVFKTISPLFDRRIYEDGEYLAVQGQTANGIFFVEEGNVEIYHTRRPAAGDGSSDDEDESAESADEETTVKRQRLKRQGSMLKTMFCATVRASRLVSAVRSYAGGDSALLAVRGPGSFIGEVQVYENAGKAQWQTCVRAKGQVSVLMLFYKDVKDLITKRPEVEADVRAIMAQRKGELLKMEMLERLAGMLTELKAEVEHSSLANGASESAVSTARELLGCHKARLAQAEAGKNVSDMISDVPPCPAEGAPMPDPEKEPARGAGEEDLEDATSKPYAKNSFKVEQSKGSFEAKGDSAKTLSVHNGGKSSAAASGARPPEPAV